MGRIMTLVSFTLSSVPHVFQAKFCGSAMNTVMLYDACFFGFHPDMDSSNVPALPASSCSSHLHLLS